MGLSVVGLVVLILKCRKLEWREAQLQLSGDSLVKTVYGNAGMIAFAVLSLIFIILALF
jgi:DMSO/TMAO reductase YedYZ heme-binding membrane subunit